MHRLIPSVLAGVLLLAGPALSRAQTAGREVAVLEKCTVHSGPGVDFFVIQDASRGEVFDLLEEQTGWVKVKLPDGAGGWLPIGSVEVASVAGEQEVTRDDRGVIEAEVTAERAKLHAGPRETFVVVKQVRGGTMLQVIGRDPGGDWLKVRLDGPPAWIRRAEVEMAAPESWLPEASARLDSRTAAPEGLDLDGAAEEEEGGLGDGFGILRLDKAPPLPVGWVASAGVGFSQLSHKLSTDTGDAYGYSLQAFAFDGEVSYWHTPTLGGRFRTHVDLAPKRLKADRQAFEIDDEDAPPAKAVDLTASVAAIDAMGVARVQVLRPGTWVEGRVGWRWWSYDVDLVQTEPNGPNGPGNDTVVAHPAFNPTSFTGPVFGGGFRMPLDSWVGVHGGFDLVPFAIVSDPFESGGLDTRSGDVDGVYGMSARGGFWLTPYESPEYDLDLDIRLHWERFFTDYIAPASDPSPRTAHRFLDDYTSADSQEGVFGAVVAIVYRR